LLVVSHREEALNREEALKCPHSCRTFANAGRRLRKSRGFTAVCASTLALGIGANTAIFTLIHALMLWRLPVASPKQLYRSGGLTIAASLADFRRSGLFVLTRCTSNFAITHRNSVRWPLSKPACPA
jgi:hypothetical protein